MTNEEASFKTKKALCEALKKLMSHKPFSKITISELIRECNVNRKTFYYHFQDIYALLKWMIEQEAIEVVKQYDLLVNYKNAISFVVDYVNENAYLLNCAYDSLGRDMLKQFFYKDFIGVVENIIMQKEKELQIAVNDDFRNFLVNLYTEGLAGMLINLFQNPTEFNKDKITSYLSVIITDSLPAVLMNPIAKKEGCS